MTEREANSYRWWEDLTPAAERIRPHLAGGTLDALVVLGSGLGGVADRWKATATFPAADLPGSARSTVSGHKGIFRLVRVGERNVLIQQGRIHLYEGGGGASVLFAVRLARRLGARWLVLTNAAGSLDPAIAPGTLLILEDTITFLIGRPLGSRGALSRQPGVIQRGSPFDAGWVERLRTTASELEIPHDVGVLCGGLGPNYETKAEVAAFRGMGAHAGTMSTVIEAAEGRAVGMRVAGVSSISNLATGLSEAPLDHDEVLELGASTARNLGELLEAALREGPA